MSSRDYEEFVESLTRHGARFLIVGAHAVAICAQPQATKDLGILFGNESENTVRGTGPRGPTGQNSHKSTGRLRRSSGETVGLGVVKQLSVPVPFSNGTNLVLAIIKEVALTQNTSQRSPH